MEARWIRGLRGRRREEYARAAVRRFAAGGLSGAEFCRREGMSPMTLGRWRRAFGEPAGGGEPGRFVEVHLDRDRDGKAFELDLASGGRLRIPAGFAREDLERLLAILERASC